MSATKASQPSALTGGECVVQALLANDIERVYCVPGESYLAVIDALYDVRDTITQVTCRHESGAAIMALAEAELSQRPSICFVTRGPGTTNASIALHMAKQASVPLVLGIGQVSSGFLGRESFQEMDYTSFLSGVCKSVTNISDVSEIPQAMQDAFDLARAGRPGPVAVVFPEDILKQETRAEPIAPTCADPGQITPQMIREPLDMLSAAEKPLIIAGGSLWPDAASEQLTALGETLRIPVVTAFRRNDAVDNFSDCYAGYLGLNQFARLDAMIGEADCIAVLGPRLDEPTSAEYSLPAFYSAESNTPWIHIYPDFEALERVPRAALRVETAPAAWLMDAAQLLSPASVETSATRESWYQHCHQQFRQSLSETFESKYDPRLIDLPRLMGEFNTLLPDDAIITTDAGNFTLWPQRLRQYRRPGRLLAPINGAMGYGVPSGIAASLMHPDRTVVSFVGDGGFMMTGMELSTAVKYGAKPIIIVFNNSLYGTIDSHQRRNYPGREHGNDLANPDFVAFAESFGAAAVRVATVEDFANAFLQARQLDDLAIIELALHYNRVSL